MYKRVKKENGIVTRKEQPKAEPELQDGSRTLLQVLQNMVAARPNEPFLGTIIDEKVVYKTYAEVLQASTRLACFLETITEEDDIVGLYSVNRTEWIVAEYATYLSHCTNCPIFSNHSVESLTHILNETQLHVLVASAHKARSLMKLVLINGNHQVRHVILMDEDPVLASELATLNIKTYVLANITSEDCPRPVRPEPSPEDTATICYTSGTSGVPKGVVLTHRNFISALSGFMSSDDPNDIIRFSSEETYISYLPLPHVLERVCFNIAVAAGIKIGFYRGNPRDLQKDCQIIKPSFIVVVPRVLNVFKEKIEARVAERNFIQRALFNLGVWYKKKLQRFLVYNSWLFDKLIFGKVSSEFGGRLRCCLCGGAALNPEVLRFIQATMSMKIFQGYGQTEGLAADIIMPLDVYDDDSVGVPFPGIEARIDCPSEYGEDRGELLLRGGHVTKGYYKRPKETAEAFTEDGWLRTGDIACEKEGLFYIVGRIKEVFKTSFGEYVVPEVLENHFIGGIIEDMFIATTRFSDFLVAVVVCSDTSVSEDAIKEEVGRRAAVLLAKQKIMRYEVPSSVIVAREPFATLAEGSLMTPSFKKRRAKMYQYFRKEIEAELNSIE